MKILHASLLAGLLTGLTTSPALAQELLPANPQIDYRAFSAMTAEVEDYRSKRLLDFEGFVEMAKQENAVILDTRSRNAFEAGHMEGAINLPFSDFTEDKLAEILGDTDRPILIYCNNNFSDNRFPIATKMAPLALNIPTFINLYGYGYKNIYELNDVVSVADEKVQWTGLSLREQMDLALQSPANADASPAN